MAMIAMIRSVLYVEAAFTTVKLHAGFRLETIMFGYNARPKRNVKAAMVHDDERKAWNGLPARMLRGMLAIARTLSTGTIHVHGYARTLAVACGIITSVYIVLST